MFRRVLLPAFRAGLLLTSSLVNAEEAARVETSAGPVQGVVNAKMVSYLGIPYAEPPLGELRWRPPEPKRSWKAVLDATHFRDHCPQFPLNKELTMDQTGASEDCLFLNVYAPRAEGSKQLKPVMVWIHGGANILGASDSTDPAPLIETGHVVLVSMNYRLGALGFMAHPALDAEGHPFANYGVLDQQLALKWVRDNIARFGGDPHNVTIFGVSAGGLNVTTHLISPASAGLFHKAIIQSGAYMLDTPSLSYSEKMGVAFAKRVGCDKQAAKETTACLRALSVTDILAHLSKLLDEDNPPRIDKFLRPGGAYPQMTVDGQILPQTHRAAIDAGKVHRVPVLLGSTSDEEKEFQCGALDSQRSFSKWVPTYAYEFADPASTPKGAVHGADQGYILGWRSAQMKGKMTGGPPTLPPSSRALSEEMRLSWAAFAASGNPSSARIPKWVRASEGIQRLHPTLSVVTLEDFSSRHGCASD